MKIPRQVSVLFNKLVEAGFGPIREAGVEYRCRCPAHDDRTPSLYIALTEGKILLNCKAGCEAQAICNRLDHDLADLYFFIDDSFVEVDDDINIVGECSPGDAAAACAETAGPAATAAEPQADDIALRNDVYQGLLDDLELSTTHFEDLRRRGLPAEEITRRGYRTAAPDLLRKATDKLLGQHGPDRLVTVPGFADRSGRIVFSPTSGLFIPARQPGGVIAGIKVRHDDGRDGPKYTWASSRSVSCGNVVHVPLGVTAPSEVLRLTEGELKADVATALSKVPTISAPGVSSWPLAAPVLKALGARRVLLAFDRDGKSGTLTAVEGALCGLTREGFDVVAEWWDGALGKGIDDLLAVRRDPEVVNGLAALVRARDELSPPGGDVEAKEAPPAPFPIDVFPPALAAYCREVAAATSTPPDFAGLAMLVTAGSAIGNSRALCLKKNTWYESPRFYVGTVGYPSTGKTPAVEQPLRPYRQTESQSITAYKAAKGEYEQAVKAHERAGRRKRAGHEGDGDAGGLPPEEPRPPERFLVGNVTVEALAPLLEYNPRGLQSVHDEGLAWVRGMNQYKGGEGNDRQFWLSCWSGAAHTVDRKSQGLVPVSIPRPFVNVLFNIPPDVLDELADARGRDDGFLARLLWAYPDCWPGADWTEETVSDTAEGAWASVLEYLRALPMCPMKDGVPGYQVVNLSPAAKEAWVAWWNSHAAELRDPGLPAALVAPWGKLKTYLARLTLVLHYLWRLDAGQGEGDVDAASVARAVRLIDYFKSHTRRVCGRLRQTPEEQQLLRVLEWVRRERGGQCTARDLVRAHQVTPTEKAKKALAELAARDYGRLEQRPAINNRTVTWFVYDPR